MKKEVVFLAFRPGKFSARRAHLEEGKKAAAAAAGCMKLHSRASRGCGK
jgi:hypothetical protein